MTLDRTLGCQDLLDSEIDPHNLTHCNSLFDGVVLRGLFSEGVNLLDSRTCSCYCRSFLLLLRRLTSS